jgi:hypothetical protein
LDYPFLAGFLSQNAKALNSMGITKKIAPMEGYDSA